jgi:hypothetical protein
VKRNKSAETTVNVEKILLVGNLRKRNTAPNNQDLSTRHINIENKKTVYRKQEKKLPINEFFIKLFNLKKDEDENLFIENIEKHLNASDVEFSDLECLKYWQDDDDSSSKQIATMWFDKEKPIDFSFVSDKCYTNFLTIPNPAVSKNEKQISDDSNVHSSLTLPKKTQVGQEQLQGEFYHNYLKNYHTQKIRKTYFIKLTINNHLPTNKIEPIEKNNFFIFDWDDTFLCTSHLTSRAVFKLDQTLADKEIKIFKELEDMILKILNFAISRGHTYIITNAVKGWVEYSATRFYPRIAKLLSKLCVISARGEFEGLYPNENKAWKTHTFLNLSKVFNVKALTNIICVGDSKIEIDSSQILCSKFPNSFLKSIKFRENPKPEELLKELKLVSDQFETIYSAVKCLTINVEKKPKKGVTSKRFS